MAQLFLSKVSASETGFSGDNQRIFPVFFEL